MKEKYREKLFDDGPDLQAFRHVNDHRHGDRTSMLFGVNDSETSSIPMTKSSSSGSSGALSGTSDVFNALGGNLHNLKSSQITKVINSKYNGDPILLIRQLSLDLAKKERDLILQRQESFTREQKLYKLCNEFGNLSTLEIDHKLSHERHNHENINSSKVDDILSNLISSAINDNIDTGKKPGVSKTPSPESEPSESHQKVLGVSLLKGSSQESIKPPTKKNWLRSLFSSSEDLPQTGSTLATAPKPNQKTTVAPVELVSFGRTPSTISLIDNEDANIDKYGFFTDKSNVRITRSSTISLPTTRQRRRSNTSPPDTNNAILIGNNGKAQYIDKLKQISKIHDSTNLKVERDWDNLMKAINLQSYKLDLSASDVIVQLGTFGINLIRLDGNDDIYNWFINLTHQYGIPQKYRRLLWMELSGANNIKINGVYQELNGSPVTCDEVQLNINQINLDLHRTLPFNYFFNNLLELKPGPNFYKLQRILYAFVKHCPEIGYVQGMNKVVGTLLLSVLDEEDIFWLLIALCNEILPRYNNLSFFNSISLIHKDNVILKQVYLDRFVPKLNQHLIKLGGLDIDFITMNWWLTLFIDLKFLDLDSWFKIFDNLLIMEVQEDTNDEMNDDDRSCKFISLTLAILKCLEPSLLALHDKESIYIYLSSDNNYHNDMKYTNVKFSDLTKHHLAISKKISSKELIQLRHKI